jgi:hypothetical protein
VALLDGLDGWPRESPRVQPGRAARMRRRDAVRRPS